MPPATIPVFWVRSNRPLSRRAMRMRSGESTGAPASPDAGTGSIDVAVVDALLAERAPRSKAS